MTQPLAVASNKTYTVTFDGSVIRVHAKRRGKLLREIPMRELVAVEYKPSTGIAGGSIRFRTVNKFAARELIFFRAVDQPDMEHLATTVQRYWRPQAPLAAPMDPWSAHPVTAAPRRGAVYLNGQASAKPLLRMLRLSVWLEGLNIVLLLVPILLVVAAVGAFLILR